MKKIVPTILIVAVFTMVFMFFFRSCASATEYQDTDLEGEEIFELDNDEGGFDLKTYVQEKIVPIVIGVLTAASALIASLASISRSLGKIKDARDEFKKEAAEREKTFKAQSELLKGKADELIKIASELPKLKGEILSLQESSEKLILECSYISKMISLGFGEDKNVIKSGSGAKIKRLEGECRQLAEGGETK